ncbi:MAG: exo-alpha-sialidase [Planctomycetaceae bacterium]|nr:exo-alpha-sialidase [Planctomycetaceae bacterium]
MNNERPVIVKNYFCVLLLILLTCPVDATADDGFPLWDDEVPLPVAAEIPVLAEVEFHVIKKWDRGADGYRFLHGVGLAWHEGKLYASIGHNQGAENTVTEEAQFRVSDDGGQTWGPLRVIDTGDEENLAVSHGVFLSHEGVLWAFHGAYYGKMERVHTRAYRLDKARGEWEKLGVVLDDGFWPMNQPVRMADSNWIMPGFSSRRDVNERVSPAAVAICNGDDFTKWDFVSIPVSEGIDRMWGESALFVDGQQVYNIARYGSQAVALVAKSSDYGRSWSPSQLSNLPMTTSKPAAGVLSNGQRYLVCTTASENGARRTPLTITVSKPGENRFSKVFVIRHSMNPGHPGESADELRLSYPYAIEHEGKLYVGYSNDGGRGSNQNSAELAVIPIRSLE